MAKLFSYVIMKGKRYLRLGHELSRIEVRFLAKAQERDFFCKLRKKRIVYKHGRFDDGQATHSDSSNSFWFCVGRTSTNNKTDNKFLFACAVA